MDSGAPNPQETGFQWADTRFDETQTDDQQRSPNPRLAREQAIESLIYEEDGDIFAWLKLARSLLLKSEHSPDLPRLARAQIRAIIDLSHCNLDHVIALLHQVRTSRAIQTSAASVSHPSHNRAIKQEIERSSILFGASLPSLFVTSPNGGTHQQNLSQVPAATVPLAQQEHKYYCTYCDSPQGFDSQDDWLMHEEGHFSIYICMLNGAAEATPHGLKCVFCGVLVPFEGSHHLLTHNAQSCGPEVWGRFSCNAREEMIDHVNKAHHIIDRRLSMPLVNKWKAVRKRRAWSCGFCVKALADFEDRSSHIASHFEQGKTIDEWDTTKVIQGLLQQPGLIEAWDETRASQLIVDTDCLYWEKDAITDLRHDLEVGPNTETSARDLAEAALAASKKINQEWDDRFYLPDLDAFTNP